MIVLGLSPPEWDAVGVSIVIALRAVAIFLPVAIAAAWAMSRFRFPGRLVLDVVLHASLVLPPVVIGFALLLLLGAQGPVGQWLDRVGVHLVFTSLGASIAAGVMAFPLMLRLARQAFDGIDPRFDDAAAGLGAGPLDRFWTITLPLAAPGLIAAGAVGFAACLGEFGAVITFAANVPGETQTLALAIYSALQLPGGEKVALRLSAVALTLALTAMLLAEWLLARTRQQAGR